MGVGQSVRECSANEGTHASHENRPKHKECDVLHG